MAPSDRCKATARRQRQQRRYIGEMIKRRRIHREHIEVVAFLKSNFKYKRRGPSPSMPTEAWGHGLVAHNVKAKKYYGTSLRRVRCGVAVHLIIAHLIHRKVALLLRQHFKEIAGGGGRVGGRDVGPRCKSARGGAEHGVNALLPHRETSTSFIRERRHFVALLRPYRRVSASCASRRKFALSPYCPITSSIWMTLVLALAFGTNYARSSACWQRTLYNGKCNEIFSLNISKAECCGVNQDFSYTDRVLSSVEYFFATAIGGGMECSPCLESCKNVNCGPNKKCAKRRGRPKCICAPECGATVRQRHKVRFLRGDFTKRGSDTTLILEKSTRGVRSFSSEIQSQRLGLAEAMAVSPSRVIADRTGVNLSQRRLAILQTLDDGIQQKSTTKLDPKQYRRLLMAGGTRKQLSDSRSGCVKLVGAAHNSGHSRKRAPADKAHKESAAESDVEKRCNGQRTSSSPTSVARDLKGITSFPGKLRKIGDNPRESRRRFVFSDEQPPTERHGRRHQYRMYTKEVYGQRDIGGPGGGGGGGDGYIPCRRVAAPLGATATATVTARSMPTKKITSPSSVPTFVNDSVESPLPLLLPNVTELRQRSRADGDAVAAPNSGKRKKCRDAVHNYVNSDELAFDERVYDKFNLHGFPDHKHKLSVDRADSSQHPVCGTDGRTYGTECQLKKRACRTDNVDLIVAYRGHCRTTCNGVKCLSGLTCVEDHYTIPHCIACRIDCPWDRGDEIDTKRAICGVDGKTYKSVCDINRMICKIGRSIGVAYPGPCRDDRVTCGDINCGPKRTCLVDLLTHEPRCVSCRFKCSRKRLSASLRHEENKICGANNRTYNSWCEMRKDSCTTGIFIDVLSIGECKHAD